MILSDNISSKLIYSPVRNSLDLISLRSCIDMYRSTWAAYSCWLLVQFSCSVLSHSLPTSGPPGAYSNSCPLSQWCFPTICLLLLPSIFPASGSFAMSQLFTSSDQSIGVSTLASVLLMNIQDWFPLEWTSWISLPSKGLSRVFFKSINSSVLLN